MTKKLSCKLLSVILTIAICASAVFGCLITANAADLATACYSWSDSSVNVEKNQATVKLTLDSSKFEDVLSGGIYSALFNIESEHFVIADLGDEASVKIVGGTRADGASFVASDYYVDYDKGTKNPMVEIGINSDDNGDETTFDKRFSTIQLEITLSFTTVINSTSLYPVTLDNLFMSNGYEEDNDYVNYTGKAVVLEIKPACEHVIAVKGTPINTDSVNGYTVYKESYCTLCEEEFGYQLVPGVESSGGKTITWSAEGAYDADLIDTEDGSETGEADKPIIIDSVEEIYYLATKAGIEATANKYFKLADGIDNVVLQSKEVAADIMALDSAAAVNTYFSKNGGYKWDSTVSQNPTKASEISDPFAFAGNFDGNGATFYGLYDTITDGNNDAAGLFPYVYVVDTNNTAAQTQTQTTITFSNINIKNSHLTGTYGMGFIVGKSMVRSNEHYDWTATFKKCTVINNYMHSTSTNTSGLRLNGLVMGRSDSYSPVPNGATWAGRASSRVDNCLIYGNIGTTASNYEYGISVRGVPHNGNNYGGIKNSIVLGTTPYTSAGDGTTGHTFPSNSSNYGLFTNVYTDAPTTVVYSDYTYNYTTGEYTKHSDSTVTKSGYKDVIVNIGEFGVHNSVKGYAAVESCPNLDWANTWTYGVDGAYPSLIQGTPSVVYWDNTNDTNLTDEKHTYSTQDGSAENPIIIDSVAELYYLSRAGVAATQGNYYKVADGIDVMVLQNVKYANDIIALENAAKVKAFFSDSNKIASPYQWYQGSAIYNKNQFAGHFDGNGVEIYGLYSCPTSTKEVGGLFSVVETGSTFKNFALKNSYLNHAVSDNFNFGGVIGNGISDTTNGLITMESIAAINNYLFKASDAHTKSGILVGYCGGDSVIIKNCLVYGNDATYSNSNDTTNATYEMSLRGSMHNQIPAPQEYIDANPSYVYSNATYGNCYRGMVIDTVALDCLPYNVKCSGNGWAHYGCYDNVYTNMDLAKSTGITAEQWATTITKINDSDLSSAAAQKAAMDLAWGTVWYANGNGYPSLAAIDKARTATTSNSAIALIGPNATYNEDGSLDFNFHFIPAEGYNPVLYVGKTDEKSGVTEFISLDTPTESNARAQLGEKAMMFTIPNLAARDVNTTWVVSLVATNGAVTEWGKSEQISLGEYAEAILNGDVTYVSETVKAKYEQADKKVAAALLNYADAATTALGTANDVPTQKTRIVQYGSGAGVAPTKGQGTENDPYIIETAENLLYIAKEGIATVKKYYKVADDIKAFVLQSADRLNAANITIDELMQLDENGVMDLFYDAETGDATNNGLDWTIGNTTTKWQNWNVATSSTKPFMGNFDGNGATIYGLVSQSANGLFGYASDATIKNINIKSSFCYGYNGGLIVKTTPDDNTKTVKIEGCTITDSAVLSYRTNNDESAYKNVGVIGGRFYTMVDIDNCLISDVIAYNCYFIDKYTGENQLAAIGGFLNGTQYSTGCFANSIILGVTPYTSTYANWSNHGGMAAGFNNVYTDANTTKVVFPDYPDGHITYTEAQIKQITDFDSMKGKNAASTFALDFDNDWMITSGYPQPVQSGYTAEGGKTIYWDGERTAPTEGDGTEENPIIINTAAELAYVAYSGINYTTNGSENGYSPKYFEIADGIDKIVLQPAQYASDIISLASVDKVKDYFTKHGSELKQWTDKAFKAYNDGFFGGIFDGKGVEIYGMYCNPTDKHAALFPCVDGNASISNVSIINSYNAVEGSSNYGAAGIVANIAYSASQGDMSANNVISLDNCKVANSYFSVANNNAGNVAVLLARASIAALRINNCLVYGNESWLVSQEANYLVGTCSNAVAYDSLPDYIQSSIPTEHISGGCVLNMVMNSVILDASPIPSNGITIRRGEPDCYINVYTNTDIAETWSAGSKNYTDDKIMDELNAEALKGAAAADIVAALNAGNNGEEVWYVGAVGDYPGFKAATAMPSWLQSEYDLYSVGAFNNYGANTITSGDGANVIKLRSSSLNLGANPYVSFVFTFKGEYLTNRENISITLKTADREYAVSVPAYSSERLDGQWINKVGNTSHTYQFTDMTLNEFVNEVEVWATYGGETKLLGTVSAEGLATSFMNANKKTPCNYYANVAEAAKAVCFYASTVYERISIS